MNALQKTIRDGDALWQRWENELSGFIQYAKSGGPKVLDIGEAASTGEHLHVNLLHRCKDMRDDVTLRKIAGDRGFIEEARDLLTDTLQWMDKNDG